MNGLDSYDNGPKNTWRGWQWNEIVKHLPEFKWRHGFDVRKMNNQDRRVCAGKNVLYLRGPEDKDVEHALRRGFREGNLIAVDINEANVRLAKQAGQQAVCGKLQDVISEWGNGDPIDVVVADMCCAFNGGAIEMLYSLLTARCIDNRSVVSVNLQRGRDSVTDTVFKERCDIHRARRWWLAYALEVIEHNYRAEHGSLRDMLLDENGRASEDNPFVKKVLEGFRAATLPEYYSYRASPQKPFMDSVVMSWIRINLTRPDAIPELPRDGWRSRGTDYLSKRRIKTKRRIAAMRAVHTMRQNGTLPAIGMNRANLS